MFENIIGQDRTISILRDELEAEALPGSILIHGEPYSGKLSTALEIARVLCCREGGAWTCGCRSCELHRVLSHPGSLLLGSRSFGAEIAASGDVLLRLRSPSARYLYVRAVRKLVRRCDPHLWEGAETKMRPAFAAAADIEEDLQAIEPGGELPGDGLAEMVRRIGEKARQVAAALPKDNTPIAVIRKATFWARLSSTEPARIVTIENADRMVDASRNSLLKLLEEPPPGLHLILLTTNLHAVIPTILSRVRKYRLDPRTEATSREVLSRVFREDSGRYASLAQYFLSWERVSGPQGGGERGGALAELFMSSLCGSDLDERPLMALYDKSQRESALDAGSFFREFARSVAEAMRARGRNGTIDRTRLEAWNRLLQEAASQQSLFNLQPMLILQATLYRMRGAAA